MKKTTKRSPQANLTADDLRSTRGGAMDLRKLFPTLFAAENAIADLQDQIDGGPYHPGGEPPDYGNLIK